MSHLSHVPKRRPACWTENDTSPRGEWAMGWPEGVKPGWRNPYADWGRSCGTARTPQEWITAVKLTPLCRGCARARRSLEIAAGITKAEE